MIIKNITNNTLLFFGIGIPPFVFYLTIFPFRKNFFFHNRKSIINNAINSIYQLDLNLKEELDNAGI